MTSVQNNAKKRSAKHKAPIAQNTFQHHQNMQVKLHPSAIHNVIRLSPSPLGCVMVQPRWMEQSNLWKAS